MKHLHPPPLFFSVRLPTLLAMFWRRHIRRAAIYGASRHPLSFLIFRLDALGDVVLTTPLFRALKTAHPEARCTVVVQEQYKSLLVTNPHIDEILTLPRIRPAWLPRRLKQLVFDAAYDICLPPGPVRHEVLRNLAIAEVLGVNELDGRIEIRLTEHDRRKAGKLLAKVSRSTKLIAIGIGANSPGRRWPLERYADVVAQLSKQLPVQPAIVCSGPELGEALKLAHRLPFPPIILSGAGLREVCAVLERCELFLGNDSGTAHLAAAMDCKVIVISRHPLDGDPNHCNSPVRFAPQCALVKVIQPSTGLDECREGCCVATPHCITGVSVDRVVAAARTMLSEKRSSIRMPSQPWPEHAARQRLLYSHSAEAIRRAVETVRPEAPQPLAPV